VGAEGLGEQPDVDRAGVVEHAGAVLGDGGVDLAPVVRGPLAADPAALDQPVDDPREAAARHAEPLREHQHLQAVLRVQYSSLSTSTSESEHSDSARSRSSSSLLISR
jgi:hypothetical protein